MENLHPDLARILVPEETIEAHVKVLAHQISLDYADKGSIYLVGVLRGAFIFLADLVRHPHGTPCGRFHVGVQLW